MDEVYRYFTVGKFKGSNGKTYFIYVPAPYYHFDDYAEQDKHYCYGFIYLEGHAVLAVYRDKWHMETNECNPHGRWMKLIRNNRDLISVGGCILALKKGVPDNEDFVYYDTSRIRAFEPTC